MNRKSFFKTLVAGIIGAPLSATEHPMAKTMREVQKAFNQNNIPRQDRWMVINPQMHRALKRNNVMNKGKIMDINMVVK